MPNPVFDRMLVAPLTHVEVPLFLAGLVPECGEDDSAPSDDQLRAWIGPVRRES